MNCKNCGKLLAENARFCGSCGTKVEQETMGTVSAAVPTPVVPTPVEPVAAVPTPVEPIAAMPTPVEPIAAVPTPVEPIAAVPTPVEPIAAVPTPVEPAPTPVEPAPTPAQSNVGVAVLEKPQQPAWQTQSAAPAAAETIPAQAGAAVKTAKKPIVPIIIAAVAAILVIAGVLIFAFGRSTLTRTFMGEERYAVSLVTRYAEETAKSDPFISTVTSANSDTVENALTSMKKTYLTERDVSDFSATAISDIFSAAAGLVDENGMAVAISGEMDVDKTFMSTLNEDKKDALKVLAEVIKTAEITAAAKADGDNIEMAFGVDAEGQNLDVEIYKADDDSIYIMCDDLFEQPILIYSKTNSDDYEEFEEVVEEALSAEPLELDKEKLSELYGKIIAAWEKAYKNAEFTYEKAEYTIGSGENEKTFKGQKISAELEEEDFCDFLIEVLELINDDNYIDDLITEVLGDDAHYIHDSLDDYISTIEDMIDDDTSLTFIADTYVTSSNKPCGVEFTVSGKNNGEKKSLVFSSLSAGGNTQITLSFNKVTIVDILSETTGADSGVLSVQINTSTTEKKLVGAEIVYSGAKTAEAFDTQVITGKFEITPILKGVKDDLSDQTLYNTDSGSVDLYTALSKSKVTIESEVSGGKLEFAIGADFNKVGSANVKFELEKASNTVAKAPDMSSVVVYDEVSGVESVDMQLYALKSIKQKLEASDNLAVVADEYFEFGIDKLENKIASLEEDREFYAHYSGYSSTSYRDASNDASSIYSEFSYGDNAPSYSALNGGTFTLKLWFDENGKVNVIDSDGFTYDLESVFTDSYKNRYAEVIVEDGYLNGVSVVLTDSANDIPSKMPNYFNFYDRVFEFDYTNSSYNSGSKDNFVIGTYPSLSKGSSTTEEKVKETIALVDDYNAYAQSTHTAFEKFLNLHSASVNTDSYGYIGFTIDEDGNWSTSTSLKYDFSVSLEEYKEQLYSLLSSSTSGLKSAYAKIYVQFGKVVGATVSSRDVSLNLIDFKLGVTDDWSGFADGVKNSWGDYYAIGTYPIIASADSAAMIDKALDSLAGKWKLDYYSDGDVDEKTVTLTKEELGARVNSDCYIYVYSTSFTIYDADGKYILEYDVSYWSEYEYIYLHTEDGEYYKYTRDF